MIINETEVEINNVYQLYPKESNTVNFQYQYVILSNIIIIKKYFKINDFLSLNENKLFL